MKFLFFDIECSNCFNGVGKMCEFGYVLMDENFKILKMDDIPMSPGKGRECRFHLRDRMKQNDITLAYEEEYYFQCKEFPYFYKTIERLVCDPDTICFAFSADNDIMHLYNSCKRYNLKPFHYVCYDIQKLGDKYLESKNQMNLKNTHMQIVGPNKSIQYQEHLSRDDARMTADIFEAICVLDQKTSIQLLEESLFAKFDASEFVINFFNKAKAKANKTKAFDLYREEAGKNFEKRDLDEYKGKRYNISGKLKRDPNVVKDLIEKIQASGNIVVNAIDFTDTFVVLDEENKNQLAESIGDHFSGEYMLVDELLK